MTRLAATVLFVAIMFGLGLLFKAIVDGLPDWLVYLGGGAAMLFAAVFIPFELWRDRRRKQLERLLRDGRSGDKA